MKLVILPSDIFFFAFIAIVIAFMLWARTKEYYRDAGRRIVRNRWAVVCMIVLLLYGGLAFLDSFHYQPVRKEANGDVQVDKAGRPVYHEMRSLFDKLWAYVYPGI